MFASEEEKNVAATQKALGEPFALEFTEYVRKVRNNLMFIGILSIIIVVENIRLSTSSSLFGLQFLGWDMKMIYQVLFGINIYFLIHFIWLAWDYFIEWRLRLTGTHKIYKTIAPNSDVDQAADPRQTTLYFWWNNMTRNTENLEDQMKSIDKVFSDLDNKIRKENNPYDIARGLSDIKIELQKIDSNIKTFNSILSSNRIPASLEKFENIFHNFQNSQMWRWIIIEMLMPILIGANAVSWLCTAI